LSNQNPLSTEIIECVSYTNDSFKRRSEMLLIVLQPVFIDILIDSDFFSPPISSLFLSYKIPAATIVMRSLMAD